MNLFRLLSCISNFRSGSYFFFLFLLNRSGSYFLKLSLFKAKNSHCWICIHKVMESLKSSGMSLAVAALLQLLSSL